MEQHQKENFVQCDVKSEVRGRAKQMFGFVVQKEFKGIMELKTTSRTIVKFQWAGENEHM